MGEIAVRLVLIIFLWEFLLKSEKLLHNSTSII
jgi:hypothetical protein